MMGDKEDIKVEKSKKFALRIVKLYKYLVDEKKEFVMSKQILRSGTSIGANIAEGVYAESTLDYIHKMSVSLKECSETQYWLDLLHLSDYLSDREYCSLNDECTEILSILVSVINSMKNKTKGK